jgi:hypothetical protein
VRTPEGGWLSNQGQTALTWSLEELKSRQALLLVARSVLLLHPSAPSATVSNDAVAQACQSLGIRFFDLNI